MLLEKRLGIIGFTLILCTPFVLYNSLADWVSTSNEIYFNTIAALILFILYSLSVYRFKINNIYIDQNDIYIIVYIMYKVINYIYNIGHIRNNFYPQVLVGVVYIIIKNAFSSKDLKLKVTCISLLILAGFIEALVGILQLGGVLPTFNDFLLLTGTFQNSGPFSIYLTSILPFAFSLYLYCLKKHFTFSGYLLLFIFLFILAVVLLTLSRTAWIAGISSILFILFIFYKRQIVNTANSLSYKKKLFVIICAVGIVSSSAIYLYTIKKDSAQGRLLIWKISASMICENPLLGRGFNTFQHQYLIFQAKYFLGNPGRMQEKKVADKVSFAFNDYLQIWYEYGFLGLFLFLWLIIKIITHCVSMLLISNINYFKLGAIGSLISILIACLFSYPLEIIPIQINLMIGIGICSSGFTNKRYYLKNNVVIKGFTSIFLLVFCLVIIDTQKNTFVAKKSWYTLKDKMQMKSVDKDIADSFQELYPYLKNDGNFLLEYGKVLLLIGKYYDSIKILTQATSLVSDPLLHCNLGEDYQAVGKFKMAENNYLLAIEMIPNRMYPRYLLAKLYSNRKDSVNALKIASEIVTMDEKVRSTASYEMKAEMRILLHNLKYKAEHP